MIVQFPARNAFLVRRRTKVLIKRQPHTSIMRYRFKGNVKTDQFDIWIRNANYILKFRGISKTQSNMSHGDFLRKYLAAFSR